MSKPKFRQEWILNQLKESSGLSYTELFGKYSLQFGKSNRTFDKDWIEAKSKFEIFNAELQAEIDEIRKENEKDFVRNGLRTKYERMKVLQDLVDEAVKELNLGTFKEVKKEGDKALSWERSLTPYEKATLRRTILRLQSEISKIEGDYAYKKLIHSNDPESPIESSQVVIFQLPDNGRN